MCLIELLSKYCLNTGCLSDSVLPSFKQIQEIYHCDINCKPQFRNTTKPKSHDRAMSATAVPGSNGTLRTGYRTTVVLVLSERVFYFTSVQHAFQFLEILVCTLYTSMRQRYHRYGSMHAYTHGYTLTFWYFEGT